MKPLLIRAIAAKRPSDLHQDATYLCDTVKPQMGAHGRNRNPPTPIPEI